MNLFLNVFKIYINDINALGSSLADYAVRNGKIPNSMKTFTTLSTPKPCTSGYNRLNFSSPIFQPKGSVLHLTMYQGNVVAISDTDPHVYNDFDWDLNEFLDTRYSLALYVNLITNNSMANTYQTRKFKTSYAQKGSYYLKARFWEGSTYYSAELQVDVVKGL